MFMYSKAHGILVILIAIGLTIAVPFMEDKMAQGIFSILAVLSWMGVGGVYLVYKSGFWDDPKTYEDFIGNGIKVSDDGLTYLVLQDDVVETYKLSR